jgi:hypothetical protein
MRPWRVRQERSTLPRGNRHPASSRPGNA